MAITLLSGITRMLWGRAFVYSTVLGKQPGIESSVIVGMTVLQELIS